MPQSYLSKTILNKTKRRDPWFLDDYTINPYSGCSFNCLYCYIRGSKYGENMEDKLSIKTNAVELLAKQLANRAKKGEYGIIVLSSATDPYLQFEKEYQLTRKILEVILHYRFPVHIITKSDLVIRDFDLLKEIERKAILPKDLDRQLSQKSFITFSFSTVDDSIASTFEPGATPPSLRLKALDKTIKAGFLSGVSLMPLIPYITDTSDHLKKMFTTFKSLDIQYIFPASITLFGHEASDSKTLMLRAIKKHYPHLFDQYSNWFEGGNTKMPAYYDYMFKQALMEMCLEFDIRIRITNQT